MRKIFSMMLVLLAFSVACTDPADDEDVFKNMTPIALEPIEVGANHIIASWVSNDTTDVYRLFITEDRLYQNNVQSFPDIRATRYRVDNLTPNTTYYYRLNSLYSTNGRYSNSIKVTTRPYGPVAYDASFVGVTSFQANWGPVASASQYIFQLATDPTFTNVEPFYDNITLTDTVRFVHSLDSNSTYYYRVRAKIGDRISAASNTITVTTL